LSTPVNRKVWNNSAFYAIIILADIFRKFGLNIKELKNMKKIISLEYDRFVSDNESMKKELDKHVDNFSQQSDSQTSESTSGNTTSETAGNTPPLKDLDETPVSNFEYKYDADFGGVVITKYKGTAMKVRIPAVIEDYPVTAIGAEAFKDSGIANIYIPDSVTFIGANAFIGCNGLTQILPGANPVKLGVYEWRVLEVKDGKALLITENIIELRKYHSTNTSITWETCDLRKYLNGEFYNNTFSEEEKKQIAEITVKNDDNPKRGTPGGNDTVWWLRSPGYRDDCAACVGYDSSVNVDGRFNDYNCGVRPAFWLNLQS